MANIVTNTLAIVGTEQEIKNFKNKYLKTDFSLDIILPEPKSRIDVPKEYVVKNNNTYHEKPNSELTWMDTHYDWYKWRVDHWGTKWDVNTEYGLKKVTKNSILISFTSPWSPPIPVIQKLIKDNPTLNIRMTYYDEFFDYSGFIDSKIGIKNEENPDNTERFYEQNNIIDWLKQTEKNLKPKKIIEKIK